MSAQDRAFATSGRVSVCVCEGYGSSDGSFLLLVIGGTALTTTAG